jgi:hypothetical protein
MPVAQMALAFMEHDDKPPPHSVTDF